MSRPTSEHGDTALVLRVPEVEPPAAALGVPAHVTVLYPFLTQQRYDGQARDELAALLHDVAPTTLTFDRCTRFPDGDLCYLAPEPAEWCRRLTGLVWARWPEAPPYGGAFADVVPHLTVAHGRPAVLDEVERALTPALPVRSRAGELTVLALAAGRWRVLETLPLGA